MNIRSFVVLTLLAIAGCEKTSDVGAMQDEASGIANTAKPRLEALKARVTMLEERGKTLTADSPGLGEARTLFVETNTKLVELRGLVAQAPTAIASAAKAEHPRGELIRLMGEMRERLDDGQAEITTNLNTVESWLASMEWRPKLAMAPAPAAPTPTPAPTPESQPAVTPPTGTR
ncbi:MAG: hypothetical protein H6Q90_1339 [Deltaproteobacteria bacterium]|nr:hypothetical protein [Deltaproteobacteria bacterium]